MTMNLSSLQVPITKHFLALVKTTSDSTPLYHLVYSQCFWYAYTIWAVLALEAGARVDLLDRANRQGTHFFFGRNLSFGRGDGVHQARKPETIKEEWEKIKAVVDREFKAALQVSLTVILQKNRPQCICQALNKPFNDNHRQDTALKPGQLETVRNARAGPSRLTGDEVQPTSDET